MNAEQQIASLQAQVNYLRSRLFATEKVCHFCGERVADLLCDATIACSFVWSAALTSVPVRLRTSGAIYSCDLPVCDKCRKQGRPITFCGEEGGVFTPDFCPVHASWETLQIGTPGRTEEEVSAWRVIATESLMNGTWRDIPVLPGAIKSGPVLVFSAREEKR